MDQHSFPRNSHVHVPLDPEVCRTSCWGEFPALLDNHELTPYIWLCWGWREGRAYFGISIIPLMSQMIYLQEEQINDSSIKYVDLKC